MRPPQTKGNLVIQQAATQDNSVVRLRQCLVRALEEAETRGWCYEAITTEMRAKQCYVDPPYLSKLKTGEKPITARILDALPDDIEASFSKYYAESFGQVVIAPVTQEEAQRCLAVGLFSLLATAKVAVSRRNE